MIGSAGEICVRGEICERASALLQGQWSTALQTLCDL